MDFTKDIYINKEKVHENDEIVVLYKGSLFSDYLNKSVYLTYGYGENWENQNEVKMKPSTFGYLATLKIDGNNNLQFCFKDSYGNWDNNNQANYILPIYEAEDIFAFNAITETSKEISFDNVETQLETTGETQEEIFNPSIISSNQVELYKTVDLENITEQAIPNDTIITQINIDSDNNSIQKNATIQSKEVQESVAVAFSKLTEIAKQQSTTAFDEGKVTAGSVYVNSITQDYQETETTNNTALTVKGETSLSKAGSFIKAIFTNAKSAFSKVVKLIKTTLQFGNDEE